MADDLRRLVVVATDATAHISHRVDLVKLYREAAAVAETKLPGPLGVAIAGVLHMEAYQRDASGIRGSLGANRTVMSLALAVLELSLDRDLDRDVGPDA